MPRAMSGSLALQKPDSESVSVAPAKTEDNVVAQGVTGHLRPLGANGAC